MNKKELLEKQREYARRAKERRAGTDSVDSNFNWRENFFTWDEPSVLVIPDNG